MIARWLEHLLHLQWSVSIKSGPTKGQWWTGDRVIGGQGSLMHMGSKGWPTWSDPTDELLFFKLLKKLMLVLIERCQHTHCTTVCCVWGCIATDKSGCPCSSSLKAPTMDTCASELDHRAMKEGSLVWRITFSFTSPGWLGRCALLTWGTQGSGMHYGKKARWWRQCNALGNVVVGNFGSCHSCGCNFDTYRLP